MYLPVGSNVAELPRVRGLGCRGRSGALSYFIRNRSPSFGNPRKKEILLLSNTILPFPSGESTASPSPKLSLVRRIGWEPSRFMMKISELSRTLPPTVVLVNTIFSRGSGGSPHAGEPVNATAANANILTPASRRGRLNEWIDALRAELVVMVSPSLIYDETPLRVSLPPPPWRRSEPAPWHWFLLRTKSRVKIK